MRPGGTECPRHVDLLAGEVCSRWMSEVVCNCRERSNTGGGTPCPTDPETTMDNQAAMYVPTLLRALQYTG